MRRVRFNGIILSVFALLIGVCTFSPTLSNTFDSEEEK